MLLCAGDKEIFPRLNPESNNNKWKKKSEILNFIKVTNQKAIKKMNIQTTDCKKNIAQNFLWQRTCIQYQ